MKNIKIYIVTYKRADVLNELLENIFTSDFKNISNTEVNIINNHSNFFINEKYKSKVNVIHNMCRADWSSGNLGQNWNQALVLGFKSLRNPDAKYVVTLQNDCVLHPNWCSNLLKMHKKYNFIAGEFGDNIVSYTAEAIKNIGLWDENYAGVPHKEADYYLRALYFNKEKSLINDTLHKRVWNPNNDYLTLDIPDGRPHLINKDFKTSSQEHIKIAMAARGTVINQYNFEYFLFKWSGTSSLPVTKQTWIKNWPDELKLNPPCPKKNSMFLKYPYFEKDIIKLKKKGYWVPDNFNKTHWDQWEFKTINSNS